MEKNFKVDIFFLHGFSGSTEDFSEIIEKLAPMIKSIPLSLSGHIKELPPCSLEEEVERITFEIKQKKSDRPTFLCGYSMGGRLATMLTQKLEVDGLILLSSGIGVDNTVEKEIRLINDRKWAKLLSQSSDDFFQKWYAQDLFCGINMIPFLRKSLWENRKKNLDPNALSKTFINFAPTQHSSLMPLLKAQGNFLYLVGELDKKYSELSKFIKKEVPQASIFTIPKVSHLLPIEAPQACAEIINQWIQNSLLSKEIYAKT